MKRNLAVVLILSLVLGSQVRAEDDRDKALMVLNKAIRFHGGAERLARAQVMSRKANAVMTYFDKEIHFTTQLTLAFPDRFRDLIAVEAGTQKVQMTRVVNKEKGWQTNGGAPVEISPEELGELREETYVLWLTTLVPLKDADFQLKPLPETKVNSQPVAGILVTRKGHGDAKLYFDSGTGRLVKIERRARQAGLVVQKEYWFAEPREFQGMTLATKQTELVNGKKWAELTISAFDFPGKVEDSSFEKP